MKQFAAWALWLFSFNLQAQVTIIVTHVPDNTPAGDELFIAGNFNSWDPGNTEYKLHQISDRKFSITIAGKEPLEFKFTRGNWSSVECMADGSQIPNRKWNDQQTDSLYLNIKGWNDMINESSTGSTALKNVTLLADSFYIAGLKRFRKIWIYLPDDYSTALNKWYPVIYMHDGQNLFDNSTSFSGEWKVDETLHALQADGDYGCIVIGIENGKDSRIDEYSPFVNVKYGGGQGDEYVDFIVNDLKPFVDQNFRTLRSREFTAIAGSSLGGIISFYAAIKYQHVFSKAGIFSPSFFFSDSLYHFVSDAGMKDSMRFYFVAGTGESETMIEYIRKMYSVMIESGFYGAEMDTVFKINGAHAEWFWASEFAGSYNWLFANTIIAVDEPAPDSEFGIYPNPSKRKINFISKYPMKKVEIEIFNQKGHRTISLRQSFSKPVDVSSFDVGLYYLKVKDDQQAFSKIFEVAK